MFILFLQLGFSVQNDIQHLKKHFRIASREFQNNNSNNIKNGIINKTGCQIIDLEDLGKLKLEQNFKSLADLVKLIYKDRIFSKCEQFSNWVYRPLRLAQIHYAALDAYICINLYQNLKKM
ncbi:Ribonuclease H-like domain [Pseudocohnilembus persalinus]|uniref:Ribonuclease H-like domain n=1 Tax=Pseudocohnilembus persalinus TaxID=266149 RepID=A0A0V0R494_PSEPJ|nr:Ribonuclease H-like domain [Pseudocohnilembus persalinus]|eukprot:KRX09305.1 Ribonuclease H-like domain [Pseudocohnilembus persalinus]